jgi:hypothetical protein
MKKISASVLVLFFVFLPFSLHAGSGYYNLGLMETTQMLKAGNFMISAVSDSAFYGDHNAWSMLEEASGKLSYVIMEGLEASLEYNHIIYKDFDGTPPDGRIGAGKLKIKYAFGLGDTLRMSVGLGAGLPFSNNMMESLTEAGLFQIIPVVCLSTNLGGAGLHLQLKDLLLFDHGEAEMWIQAKAGIVFDFNGLLAAFTAGVDNVGNGDNNAFMFMGGPEIVWNVAGPLQLNIGVFGTKFPDTFFIRGVVRASLLL